MITKILKPIIPAGIMSLVLFSMGLLIWLFKKESGSSLQDILFFVGMVPVAFSLLALSGDSFGRANSNYLVSKTIVHKLPASRRFTDFKSWGISGLSLFLAGVTVWAVGYFI